MALLNLFDRFVGALAAVVRMVCITLATALFAIVIANATGGIARVIELAEERL